MPVSWCSLCGVAHREGDLEACACNQLGAEEAERQVNCVSRRTSAERMTTKSVKCINIHVYIHTCPYICVSTIYVLFYISTHMCIYICVYVLDVHIYMCVYM